MGTEPEAGSSRWSASLFIRVGVLAGFLGPPSSLAAQDYKVEVVTGAAPAELPAALRGALGDRGLRVSGPVGRPYVELWFRSPVPVAREASGALAIAYPRLLPGSLVGVARFAAPAKDYRNRQIAAGVYTLRYQLHPVDGNHMGVSSQRDFLLLSPAGDDASLEPRSFADLNERSRKASGSTHPSVWSLVKPDEPPGGGLPALVHQEEEQRWVLYATVTTQPEGGGGVPITVPIALVVVGHAPEA